MNEEKACAYCGRAATTMDHIPPRKLFPQPWSDDLITVPCCDSCNNYASRDDEYFIWVVTINAKAVGSEADEARRQRLQMPASIRRRRMATRIVNARRPVDIVTPAGVWLGRAMGYNVDLGRVDRVLERVVRGLYFVERGYRLPQNVFVAAHAEPPPDAFHWPTIQTLIARGGRSVARGAFEYWFSAVDDRPEWALCLMRFFGGVLALGFIVDDRIESREGIA